MSSNTKDLAASQSGGSKGEGRDDQLSGPRPSILFMDSPILAGFRSVSSEADLHRIVDAAGSDNHHPIAPTHLAERNGEIVGYASIGAVPMVFCWAHTKKVRARESFALLAAVEKVAAQRAPLGLIMTPCTFSSPFHKFMEKLQYHHCGDGGFFLKNLRR